MIFASRKQNENPNSHLTVRTITISCEEKPIFLLWTKARYCRKRLISVRIFYAEVSPKLWKRTSRNVFSGKLPGQRCLAGWEGVSAAAWSRWQGWGHGHAWVPAPGGRRLALVQNGCVMLLLPVHPASWELQGFTDKLIWLSWRFSCSSSWLFYIPSTYRCIETCWHFFGYSHFAISSSVSLSRLLWSPSKAMLAAPQQSLPSSSPTLPAYPPGVGTACLYS